jgi:thiol-disulfide isomerase/thioredoxin
MKAPTFLLACAAVAGSGALLGCLASCKEKHTMEGPVARYEAVKAAPTAASRWCDSSFTGDGPRLSLPPLAAPPAGRAQLTLPAGKRVWLNLWATWCQPCLREMPLLLEWQSDLRKDGVDVEVLLLSLDEDAPAYEKFLAEHKELAAAKVGRAQSQAGYELWVRSFVKDPGVPIPLHLLATAGSVRCVRAGSLREGDYPAAKSVLR